LSSCDVGLSGRRLSSAGLIVLNSSHLLRLTF
jgi:hypothetical protein